MSELEATVTCRVDVMAAAAAARVQARTCGHSPDEAHALSLVVAELAMNALRHGGGLGWVLVRCEPSGWLVAVQDDGPGLSAAVLVDGGRSDRLGSAGVRPAGDGGRSFGSGLACVRRMSTVLELSNRRGGGARAVAQLQRTVHEHSEGTYRARG